MIMKKQQIEPLSGIPGFGFLLSKIGDGLMHWVENCERSLFGKRRRTQYRVTVFIM